MIIEPILAAFGIALLSLVGIFVTGRRATGESFRTFFLPLSIGMFLAVTFFELLPEAFAEHEHAGIAVAFGFLGFFLLSRLLSEYHHHHGPHEHAAPSRSRATLILIGDGIHNFADGIVIVAAFLVDPAVMAPR